MAVNEESGSGRLLTDDRERGAYAQVFEFTCERTACKIVTDAADDGRLRPASSGPHGRIRGAPARAHRDPRIVTASRGGYVQHEVSDSEEPRTLHAP